MPPHMQKFPVLAVSIDRILFFATPGECARMVRRGQAEQLKRAVRLTAHVDSEPELCRTHTGRSPEMGAIGRSQDYTTRDRHHLVDGFKTIYPEDLHIFHAATLDCTQ